MKHRQSLVRRQKGAAAVEFALIATVFFILLIGVLEMGRVLFTWNAAAEATRYGARVAAVCDINDSAILSRMQDIMPNLEAANVSVSYLPSGCNQSNCQQVSVSIVNFQVTTHIPVVSAVLAVPPFTTSLPRESLESANNPVCT
ncbi:pilus assembly protein [Betaproteobacteria bacterium SCN2]|jgi:Flp pilus assembly protein TadG|nr:pilus assembly protein [Betaproteobacteria bacterium SCN2]